MQLNDSRKRFVRRRRGVAYRDVYRSDSGVHALVKWRLDDVTAVTSIANRP